MNKFGRVVICGSISSYNDDPKNPTKGKLHLTFKYKKHNKM